MASLPWQVISRNGHYNDRDYIDHWTLEVVAEFDSFDDCVRFRDDYVDAMSYADGYLPETMDVQVRDSRGEQYRPHPVVCSPTVDDGIPF